MVNKNRNFLALPDYTNQIGKKINTYKILAAGFIPGIFYVFAYFHVNLSFAYFC